MSGRAPGDIGELVAEVLRDARASAIDEIARAAERAAATAQATNAEMIAASAYLLAVALTGEKADAEMRASYHTAHSAMTQAALGRLLAARAAAEAHQDTGARH